MKRSWPTILLIIGLAGLLVLLGSLQYRWLTQISESDGEKARVRVKEQAERFAMDFNREIQNAYFNFQTGSQVWRRGDWAPFNERYDFWRERTTYPDLITDFYFFEAKNNARPLRYDRDGRAFFPAELTPEFSELQSTFSDDKSFKVVYADSLSLVLPVHEHEPPPGTVLVRSRTPGPQPKMEMPDKYGYLIIRLDSTTIKNRILPDLTAKYFGDGEFRAAVTGPGGEQVYQSIREGEADATAALLDLSPDNFIFYGAKDIMAKVAGEKHEATIVNTRVESGTSNRVQTDSDKQSSVKIELKRDGVPRTSVFTTTTRADNGPWTLQVQHSSGSLGTFLTTTLRRNLTLGFGLLFLLAAAIAAIVFSAQRVRKLAQRQVDFVSSVSHEFRTPLAVIYSAGENLADGVAKEEGQVARYGGLIKSEGRKLTGMVEQILDFAGANSGRRKYNFAETPVGDVVEAAIDECRPLLDEKGIVLERHVSASLPHINADGPAVSQAIQNLIVNSVKYCNGEKWIRISAENGGGKIKIAVEDRGIGVSKGDLRQIFEPFYRARAVVDAQIHGNGLGLSLVKQIIEAHGGTVNAESEVGKGSKFMIELKAEPPA